MQYKKIKLNKISSEESEDMVDVLATLEIPSDVWIVKGWLNEPRYQDVSSMHELANRVQNDPTKTAEDLERIYHTIGWLHYMQLCDSQ